MYAYARICMLIAPNLVPRLFTKRGPSKEPGYDVGSPLALSLPITPGYEVGCMQTQGETEHMRVFIFRNRTDMNFVNLF